jgi:putative serine protease PepD
VARVLPSVVQISTSGGPGSGLVYGARGAIVTNAHVVGTGTTMQVRLASGGMTPPARVVGVFAPDDLAVIRVEGRARELHPASLGKSAAARVGERLCGPFGNPLAAPGRP